MNAPTAVREIVGLLLLDDSSQLDLNQVKAYAIAFTSFALSRSGTIGVADCDFHIFLEGGEGTSVEDDGSVILNVQRHWLDNAIKAHEARGSDSLLDAVDVAGHKSTRLTFAVGGHAFCFAVIHYMAIVEEDIPKNWGLHLMRHAATQHIPHSVVWYDSGLEEPFSWSDLAEMVALIEHTRT